MSPDSPQAFLRAGRNALVPELLEKAANRSEQGIGIRGVSVIAMWPGQSVTSTWEEHPALAHRNHLWVTTASALASLGLEVRQTGSDHRHFTVLIPRGYHLELWSGHATLMERRW